MCTLLAFYDVGANLVFARCFIYYVIKEEIAGQARNDNRFRRGDLWRFRYAKVTLRVSLLKANH